MSDVRDLIAKLEAAREGSRDFDDEIALALGWKRMNRDGSLYNPTGNPFYRPNYTRSIDAALSLVPEGWCVSMSTFGATEIFNPGGAQASVHDASDGYQHAEARTLPLAVVIACLKARFPDAQ